MFLASFFVWLQIAGLRFPLCAVRGLAFDLCVNRVKGLAGFYYEVAIVRSHEDNCVCNLIGNRPITLDQEYGSRPPPETLDRAQISNHF
jgi:hypothetical protein